MKRHLLAAGISICVAGAASAQGTSMLEQIAGSDQPGLMQMPGAALLADMATGAAGAASRVEQIGLGAGPAFPAPEGSITPIMGVNLPEIAVSPAPHDAATGYAVIPSDSAFIEQVASRREIAASESGEALTHVASITAQPGFGRAEMSESADEGQKSGLQRFAGLDIAQVSQLSGAGVPRLALSGSGNIASVLQDGGKGANDAAVKAMGDQNVVSIRQSAPGEPLGSLASNRSSIAVDGNQNQASVAQTVTTASGAGAGGSNASEIVVDGNGNRISAHQQRSGGEAGENRSVIGVMGNANKASVTQR